MGDVTEFKPRKPQGDDIYMYSCPECDQSAVALEDNGSVICLFCGAYTTIAELAEEWFFTNILK